MNDLATTKETQLDDKTLFSLVTDGDAARLNDAQKLQYYRARCEAAGLDYRAQPFQYLKLNGKLVLYATKACTDQLAGLHGVRCEIVEQRTESKLRVVTVRATTKDGRATDEIGAVNLLYPDRMREFRDGKSVWVSHPKGGQMMEGDDLANALMKAVTKAKRRAILSVCGLGMTDESELETIPGARVAAPQPVVQMPRRLSEKKAEPMLEPLEDAAHAEPTPELDLEPELEAQLTASLQAITRDQQVKLFAALGDSAHTELDFREWLTNVMYLGSTKEIPKSKLDAVLRRLEDPTPLHHDYDVGSPSKAQWRRRR